MEVRQSLLINGVMITPAVVTTAKVSKAFHENPSKPFMVLCEIVGVDPFKRSEIRNIAVPCDTEEEGADIIQQIFDRKQEAWRLDCSNQELRDLLTRVLKKLEATQA